MQTASGADPFMPSISGMNCLLNNFSIVAARPEEITGIQRALKAGCLYFLVPKIPMDLQKVLPKLKVPVICDTAK